MSAAGIGGARPGPLGSSLCILLSLSLHSASPHEVDKSTNSLTPLHLLGLFTLSAFAAVFEPQQLFVYVPVILSAVCPLSLNLICTFLARTCNVQGAVDVHGHRALLALPRLGHRCPLVDALLHLVKHSKHVVHASRVAG